MRDIEFTQLHIVHPKNRYYPCEICVTAKEDGEFCYEFMLEWHDLRNMGSTLSLRVCVFSDALQAFADFPQFFVLLSQYQDKEPTVEQVVELLEKCGAKDVTDRC